jgi:hypothetical protein
MAEYYCADSENRDEEMNDVATLYGEDMAGDWSGGVFYTYAGSDYGTHSPTLPAELSGPGR